MAQVAAGSHHSVGLTRSWRVVAAGSNAHGRFDTKQWRDIVTIAAGAAHTLGLRADGTLLAAGANDHGQCDVHGWADLG